MARGIAHVTLVGNLTRDPELRQTPNGTSVCQLGVAVNSSYKDSSGQWVEKPNFFDVVVWGPKARTAPGISARAVRWRSTAVSTSAAGRPRTAASAARSRSSPIR